MTKQKNLQTKKDLRFTSLNDLATVIQTYIDSPEDDQQRVKGSGIVGKLTISLYYQMFHEGRLSGYGHHISDEIYGLVKNPTVHVRIDKPLLHEIKTLGDGRQSINCSQFNNPGATYPSSEGWNLDPCSGGSWVSRKITEPKVIDDIMSSKGVFSVKFSDGHFNEVKFYSRLERFTLRWGDHGELTFASTEVGGYWLNVNQWYKR